MRSRVAFRERCAPEGAGAGLEQEPFMIDAIFIAATLVFFGLSILYTHACGKL
jgi:hypothetical protein